MTQEKIIEILSRDYGKGVVESKEFYFQKGQDALNKWLNLPVSDLIKAQLIEHYKDYDKLKQLPNTNPAFQPIIDLFFEITSYCDIHAKDKGKYNQYEDKRSIARAGVRMGDWFAGLIKLKFKHEDIKGNSLINAFSYFTDPQNNSTILSTDHRALIAKNLFKKEYEPSKFVTDLKNYFNEFDIQVVNPDNYTYVLSVLIYDMTEAWKDEEIDLRHAEPDESINTPFLPEQFADQDFEDYIQFLRAIVHKFDLKHGDERIVFSVRADRLSFIVGQRYCWTIYNSSSKGKYGIISKDQLEVTSKKFEGREPVPYFTRFDDINSVRFNIKSNEDAIEKELSKSKRSGYRKFNNVDFENYVFDINPKHTNQMPDMNLNQILYGPPGTGKTYNSINKAITIVNPDFDIQQDREKVKEAYDRLEKEGKILFSTFHQSMSYEDFIEGIKPLPPQPGESLSYDIQAGIFKIACARAAYLCYKKYNQKRGVDKTGYTFDDLYSAFIEFIKQSIQNNQFPVFKTITGKEVEVFEVNKQGSIKARAKGSNSIVVAPLTQENLEKLYNKFNNVTEIENLSVVRDTVQVSPRSTEFYAIFGGLKEFEKTYKPDFELVEEDVVVDTIVDTEKVKKFTAGVYNDAMKQSGHEAEPVVLILDEINRGNVSQIFGELITLIEPDKRIGNPESLEVILPYSKSKFGVPANLYMIGTMNTADRSVEALDTALRRRFVFEEIPPNYDLPGLNYDFAGVKGYKILETMNKRIEKLLDKDHLLGHSYFIMQDEENAHDKLINSFYKNIIPLLQEYFFGDFGKIGLVLGQGFVNLRIWDNKEDSFADFDHESTGDFDSKDVYEIIDYRNVNAYHVKDIKMDFEKAIQLLMKLSIV